MDSESSENMSTDRRTAERLVDVGGVITFLAASSDYSLLAYSVSGESSIQVVSSQPPQAAEGLTVIRTCGTSKLLIHIFI